MFNSEFFQNGHQPQQQPPQFFVNNYHHHHASDMQQQGHPHGYVNSYHPPVNAPIHPHHSSTRVHHHSSTKTQRSAIGHQRRSDEPVEKPVPVVDPVATILSTILGAAKEKEEREMKLREAELRLRDQELKMIKEEKEKELKLREMELELQRHEKEEQLRFLKEEKERQFKLKEEEMERQSKERAEQLRLLKEEKEKALKLKEEEMERQSKERAEQLRLLKEEKEKALKLKEEEMERQSKERAEQFRLLKEEKEKALKLKEEELERQRKERAEQLRLQQEKDAKEFQMREEQFRLLQEERKKEREQELERQKKEREQELKRQKKEREEHLRILKEKEEKELKLREEQIRVLKEKKEIEKKQREEEIKKQEEERQKQRMEEQERFERLMEHHQKTLEENKKQHAEALAESRRQHEATLKHKEQLLEKKIAAQNAIADRYLGRMERQHSEEMKVLENVQKEQKRIMSDHDSRPRLLCNDTLCQKNEIAVYGSAGNPCFKTLDTKNYISSVLMKKVSFRPKDLSDFHRLHDKVEKAMLEVIDEMSFEMTYVHQGQEQVDQFVRVPSVDEFISTLEKEVKVDLAEIRLHLAHLYKNMPYSKYVDCDKGEPEWAFTEEFQQDTNYFVDTFGPSALSSIRKENVLKPDHLIQNLEKVEEEEDKGDEAEEDEKLRYGCTLEKDHVAGRSEETVSSTKFLGQKIKSCLQDVKTFFYMEVKNKDYAEYVGTVQRNFKGGVSQFRAFLTRVKNQLRNFGTYKTFTMDRFEQDQQYQRDSKNVNPWNRRYTSCKKYWQRDELNYRKRSNVCYTCKRTFDPNILRTVGHVIPRRGGTTGSDFHYNIVDLCKRCNEESGAIDPHLYDKYDYSFWFVDFKEFDIHPSRK